ncbi:MAG: hypothetical protein IJV34_03490 [Prevotella sp.]|nr:hypothetical protein [Prevotella sp.]
MTELTLIGEYLTAIKHNSRYVLPTPLTCNYTFGLNGVEIKASIGVKYIYTKEGIPFVADVKGDEVAIECLDKNNIEGIALMLNNNM